MVYKIWCRYIWAVSDYELYERPLCFTPTDGQEIYHNNCYCYFKKQFFSRLEVTSFKDAVKMHERAILRRLRLMITALCIEAWPRVCYASVTRHNRPTQFSPWWNMLSVFHDRILPGTISVIADHTAQKSEDSKRRVFGCCHPFNTSTQFKAKPPDRKVNDRA